MLNCFHKIQQQQRTRNTAKRKSNRLHCTTTLYCTYAFDGFCEDPSPEAIEGMVDRKQTHVRLLADIYQLLYKTFTLRKIFFPQQHAAIKTSTLLRSKLQHNNKNNTRTAAAGSSSRLQNKTLLKLIFTQQPPDDHSQKTSITPRTTEHDDARRTRHNTGPPSNLTRMDEIQTGQYTPATTKTNQPEQERIGFIFFGKPKQNKLKKKKKKVKNVCM